jgi:hypothetical protein
MKLWLRVKMNISSSSLSQKLHYTKNVLAQVKFLYIKQMTFQWRLSKQKEKYIYVLHKQALISMLGISATRVECLQRN